MPIEESRDGVTIASEERRLPDNLDFTAAVFKPKKQKGRFKENPDYILALGKLNDRPPFMRSVSSFADDGPLSLEAEGQKFLDDILPFLKRRAMAKIYPRQ